MGATTTRRRTSGVFGAKDNLIFAFLNGRPAHVSIGTALITLSEPRRFAVQCVSPDFQENIESPSISKRRSWVTVQQETPASKSLLRYGSTSNSKLHTRRLPCVRQRYRRRRKSPLGLYNMNLAREKQDWTIQ